jgi:hypothetical protein
MKLVNPGHIIITRDDCLQFAEYVNTIVAATSEHRRRQVAYVKGDVSNDSQVHPLKHHHSSTTTAYSGALFTYLFGEIRFHMAIFHVFSCFGILVFSVSVPLSRTF